MNPKLQTKLFKKFPEFFRQKDLSMKETCMCWGIECGDGWYLILEEFCEFLQDAGNSWTFGEDIKNEDRIFEFTQIKEKYGELTIYYNTNSTTMEDMADIMTKWAAWKSLKVCEVCGEPGKLNGGPWYQVRCAKCGKD